MTCSRTTSARRAALVAASCVVAAIVSASPALAAPAFYNVGTLPTPNPFPSSSMNGVSPDGTVGVGSTSGPGEFNTIPARWSVSTGLTGLPFDSGFIGAYGQDASLGGQFISGYRQRNVTLAYSSFRYANGVYTDLGDLPGGTGQTVAHAISHDGRTIVGQGNYNNGINGDLGFIWTEANGIQSIGVLPGTVASTAIGVSGDGRVVVGGVNSSAGVGPAVRWTATEGMSSLGALPGGQLNGLGTATSFDGSIIVGLSQINSTYEAFRWTAATGMVGLGDLPGGAFRSIAEDVTEDGATVVGYSTTGIPVGVGEEAFIWDAAHGMRNLEQVLVGDYGLNLAGWTLSRANGISADGTVIVGDAYDPQNRFRGFVAVLPEPGAAACAIGAAWLLCPGRRRPGRRG